MSTVGIKDGVAFGAKAAATRARRIATSVATLRDGRM